MTKSREGLRFSHPRDYVKFDALPESERTAYLDEVPDELGTNDRERKSWAVSYAAFDKEWW